SSRATNSTRAARLREPLQRTPAPARPRTSPTRIDESHHRLRARSAPQPLTTRSPWRLAPRVLPASRGMTTGFLNPTRIGVSPSPIDEGADRRVVARVESADETTPVQPLGADRGEDNRRAHVLIYQMTR